MVTLLGFCIVLCLLVVLIYVLKLFGWIMQEANKPKAPKAEAPAPKAAPAKVSTKPSDDDTLAAIAMALAAAGCDEEKAAIAMALNMYYNNVHDIQITRLTMVGQSTAWNSKSYGMNNAGF